MTHNDNITIIELKRPNRSAITPGRYRPIVLPTFKIAIRVTGNLEVGLAAPVETIKDEIYVIGMKSAHS
jgi:hypothetical protein